jgi:hypothetical protein
MPSQTNTSSGSNRVGARRRPESTHTVTPPTHPAPSASIIRGRLGQAAARWSLEADGRLCCMWSD